MAFSGTSVPGKAFSFVDMATTGKDVSFSTVIEVIRALGQFQSLEVMLPESDPVEIERMVQLASDALYSCGDMYVFLRRCTS